LPEVCEPFWNAYGELSGSRGYSECIPVSEVKAYCEFYGITDDWCRAFLMAFSAELNCELLEYKERQREIEQSRNKIGRKTK